MNWNVRSYDVVFTRYEEKCEAFVHPPLIHDQMTSNPNGWLSRQEHEPNGSELKSLYITREQTLTDQGFLESTTKSVVTQTEHRLAQAEQQNYNSCLPTEETRRDNMFDPNLQSAQQQSQSQPVYAHVEKKGCDTKNPAAEFPFCYNMNMLQKVQQQQEEQQSSNSNPNVPSDDKSCYRFDATQPFAYNYLSLNHLTVPKCEVCGLVFNNLTLLNQHKRIHNNITQPNERTFSCEACSIFFNNASELKSHKLSAHKTTKCCTICGVERGCEHSKTPTKKSKFIRCENNVNSNTAANFASNQAAVVAQATIAGLNGQVTKELHHPVRRRNVATVTKCHQCNGSGVVFIGMTRHADKPFHCNICDGRFSRYSSLWSHKRLHTGDKPFKCETCGFTFAKAAYLKNHLRVHTGEKPFKCDVCGMQFSQSPHLKNHERIHSGERPYQCEVCEKTFARHSTLWNHRRIHTGEKPYRCDICGSAFNQATHLKNHGKVHTGEKPHRCDICEVGFSDRFALKRHRNIHEKYGRTVPNQQTQPPSQQPTTASQPQQQHQTQTQTGMEEVYKYEVGGSIAFPGCSRPQDQK